MQLYDPSCSKLIEFRSTGIFGHAIITSMSEHYFQKYGHKLISSFSELIDDKKIPIFIFTETFDDLCTAARSSISWRECQLKTYIIDLNHVSADYVKFSKFSSNSNAFKGINKDGSFNQLKNINLWSKPLFSIIEGVSILSPYFRRIHWFDADVIAFDRVDNAYLDLLIPGSTALASLPRGYTSDSDYNIETGYVGFNSMHKFTSPLIQLIRNFTCSFSFAYLSDWTDCSIIAKCIVDLAETSQLDISRLLFDLAYYVPRDIQHRFIYSHLLGMRFDHLKGNRKNIGKSHTIFREIAVKHPYWS